MFKPLLAPTDPLPLDRVPLPAIVSPKADGFRLISHPELGPSTRNLKPIANNYVRGKIAELNIPYVDGEVVTYTNGKIDDFDTVQSKLTTRAGQPDFKILAFDLFSDLSDPYQVRLEALEKQYANRTGDIFCIHEYSHVTTFAELEALERLWVDEHGWEGLMARRLDGPYKTGRSTEREAILLKVKRWYDSEGVVIGYAEGETNQNAAIKDATGKTVRSTAKDGKVKNGTLGSLHVRWEDVEFWLSGFTAEQAAKYWAVKETLPGRIVNFKFQNRTKSGAPRFPGFRGFRDDMKEAA